MSPVRRVRRVIRKIDPWTVLKVSLVFNALMALAFLLGSVIFWSIFVNAGIPERISELAELLTLRFEADGPTYFRVVLLLAVIWTVFSTGFLTISALLYNLISDIVGGVEVVVLEETLVAPAAVPAQPAQQPARVRPAAITTAPPTPERPPATAPPPAPEQAPTPAAPAPPAEPSVPVAEDPAPLPPQAAGAPSGGGGAASGNGSSKRRAAGPVVTTTESESAVAKVTELRHRDPAQPQRQGGTG
jgi:hypothetical protein